MVHSSNLCTEISRSDHQRRDRGLQPRLCQPRLGTDRCHDGALSVDWDKLRETVATAVPFLDRVIDINYYPSEEAAASNPRWRPIGLGMMGLQDVFFALRLVFDSDEARELSTRIAEEIYLTALEASADLAEAERPAPGVRRDPGRRRAAPARPVGHRHTRPSGGRRSAMGSRSPGCATRC